MIHLSNINIKFDRSLICDGSITIHDSAITVITGKSGSGKTSLLYMIGLISTNTSYNYSFDNFSVSLSSDADVSNIRKQKIGYIFQDNSLIDCLSAKDNIINAARIAGLSITDADVIQYLNDVRLNISPDTYPKVLSGGEQQRLAIACAMAKRPELLIADEPTSSLDKENSKLVMDILKAYAQSGKKVVIASHSTSVCKYADYIYDIVEQKITLNKHPLSQTRSATPSTPHHRKTIGVGFSLLYALKAIRKGIFQKALMIFLCAVSIAFAANVSSLGDGFVDYQNSLMNKISERQISVINFTAPLQAYADIDEHLSLSSDVINKITSLNSIDTYYPYLEFRSLGYNFETLDFFNSTDVAVKTDLYTNSYTFTSDNDSDYSTIIIAPYYPEDNIAARATTVYSSEGQSTNGIFISHQLANLLNLNQSETSAILSFNLGIPIYTTNVELTVDNASSTYSADIDVSKIVDFELHVSGILDYNYTNTRSTSGDNVIYVPISMMLDYITNTKAAYPDRIEKNGILFNNWAPSAYSLYVKSFNDIESTISKIESIDPNLKAVSAYQDVVSMNEMISSVKSTASYVIVVVLLIVLILMTIIYINHTLNRRYEIAVLKANGLNKVETFEIVICEAFIHMISICIISFLVMILTSNSINLLFNFDVIQLSFDSIITVALIASASILAPTISSLLIINNFKPDRIMRN